MKYLIFKEIERRERRLSNLTQPLQIAHCSIPSNENNGVLGRRVAINQNIESLPHCGNVIRVGNPAIRRHELVYSYCLWIPDGIISRVHVRIKAVRVALNSACRVVARPIAAERDLQELA